MSEKTKEQPNVVKLRIGEIVKLDVELAEMGTEELDFDIKYELATLSDKTANIARNYQKQRTAIVKKYGKKKAGETEWTLEGSPRIDEAVEQLEKLLDVEHEFEKNLKYSDFKDLKSKGKSYIQIMKLMVK